jgi:Zn-dependent M32 family carboxypeptidase
LSRLAEIQQTMVMDAELFVPADGAPHRQDQLTTLGTVGNLLIAAAQVEKWLDESEKNKAALAAGDRRNLQLMRRQWVHDASLTSEMAGGTVAADLRGREPSYRVPQGRRLVENQRLVRPCFRPDAQRR